MNTSKENSASIDVVDDTIILEATASLNFVDDAEEETGSFQATQEATASLDFVDGAEEGIWLLKLPRSPSLNASEGDLRDAIAPEENTIASEESAWLKSIESLEAEKKNWCRKYN